MSVEIVAAVVTSAVVSGVTAFRLSGSKLKRTLREVVRAEVSPLHDEIAAAQSDAKRALREVREMRADLLTGKVTSAGA